MAERTTVAIDRLGALGDGIADTLDGPLYVPYALPGETWTADPPTLVTPARNRQAPLCRHFTRCGGCTAQHMPPALYADWKRRLVADAFARHGLAVDIAPLVRVPPRSRRRAVLTAARRSGDIVLGYHEHASHALVDLEECPVLVPAITAAFAGLREIARLALAGNGSGRFSILATPAGLDVALDAASPKPPPDSLAALAQVAERARLARLTVDGVTVALRNPVRIPIAGAEVAPPPGAFVQAVAEAEQAMVELVLAGLGKARQAADLFCGLGTFTFALARRARLLAVDGDKAAVEALAASLRRVQGLKPVETRVRDLFREPLSRKELEPFDVVVLDPPRAGAKAQAEALARSRVPTVIAVSCNPSTLARDVRLLVDGGYRPGPVTPIDQFVFSGHVEAITVLRR